jgi:hypothetical protein
MISIRTKEETYGTNTNKTKDKTISKPEIIPDSWRQYGT